MKIKKLNGDELVKHKQELDNKGFAEVAKDICKKILNGKENDVTYHELRFIIEKCGGM